MTEGGPPGPVDRDGGGRSSGGRLRRGARSLGRPSIGDVVSGLVTGLFSIPEGMAYASIGGFNPVTGLYAGMVPTVVGSVFARTVLMVTTLTSAIALSSQSTLSSAGLDPTDPHNLAALALVVGVVMALMGLLRLGSVMDFVSNAVMTGFTTGIALQIVVGVLGDATAYDPDRHNTIAKALEVFAHIGSWEWPTVAVTAATVAVWAVVRLVPRLGSLATLVALVVMTVVVAVADIDVATVGGISSIPNAFPPMVAPAWSAIPGLLVGGFAVALVALAQAAGISSAVPNPDGSRSDMSRDFFAQGAANIAGGFFQALPTGGSLSRTGVAVSAGARTRWAGIFAGLWLIGLVLLAGSVAEYIPMAVIAGLVLVIGGELIVGRVPDIVLVLRTAPMSAVAMVATFVATTQLPLQNAILIGAVLSLVLYCVKAAGKARLVSLTATDDGWKAGPSPESLPSHQVTVMHFNGVGIFAEIPRVDELWPASSGTRGAAVVLSLQSVVDVPSTAAIKALRRRLSQLHADDNLLILADVPPTLVLAAEHAGLVAVLGEDCLLGESDVLFGTVREAIARGEQWVAAHLVDPGQDAPG